MDRRIPPGRAMHLRPRYLGLVFLGGTAGTAARELLSITIPPVGAFPAAIFAINVVGAFLLGVLLESLGRHGSDDGVRRDIRLLLGTGFLGGFTTYSALAADTSLLFASGDVGIALAYSLGTLFVGGAATWAGIILAARLHQRRPGPNG